MLKVTGYTRKPVQKRFFPGQHFAREKAVSSFLAGGTGKTLKEEENRMGTHPVCDDRKRDKQQPIFESLNNCTINLYM